MKKIFIVLFTALFLNSCIPLPFQSTKKNYAQLNEEDIRNITEQIMNEVRKEINEEYFSQISEIEQKIISVVNTYSSSVLGVSNFHKLGSYYKEVGTGSGVIYKHDLDTSTYYMITNEHVIDDADKIRVVLEDKTYLDAELVGKDKVTDLAVIKFQSTKSLQVAEFGDSDLVKKGQFAIAIGNPLGYDFYGSVTVGSISGLARNVPIDYNNDNTIDWVASLIQHHAPISPGNSGGGLFDINGKLIGINNMKIVEDTVSNIGFAIPINIVKDIIAKLETKGEIIRPSLGITGQSVEVIIEINELGEKYPLPSGVTKGVYVISITPNSSADGSLQPGDVILKYNDVEINDFEDLRAQIDIANVGDKVVLTVNRNGSILEIELTLLKRPDIN